jgi:ATP-dependent DNA helicase RecQ
VEIRELAAALRTGPQTKTALKEKTGFGPRKLGQLLGLLEQVGAAIPGADNKLTVPLFAPLPAAAAEAALAEHERQQVVQRSRTDMMRAFAETRACRTQTLLAYFGEELAEHCGHCDNCLDGTAEETVPESDELFPVHSQVRHTEWGTGMVMGYEEDKMTVLFDTVGYKTLAVKVVEERELLTAERP